MSRSDDSQQSDDENWTNDESWSNESQQDDDEAIQTEFRKERLGRPSTIFSTRNVRLGSVLGEGAFGKVCKGYANNGRLMAVKVISKKSVVKQNLQIQLAQEINVHRTLVHENIIRFFDFADDKRNVYFYLEFAPMGDLLKFVTEQKPSESELSNILYQVGKAIYFCHSYGVVHRDIKPENVLMNEERIPKLTDFGYCDRIGKFGYCKNPLFCGTTDYMAPEMIDEKPCSYPLDVWAFGVMIYDLLCGEAPFTEKKHEDTYERIRNCEPKWNKQTVVRKTKNVRPLLDSIFVYSPTSRPTMKEVLQDEWFYEN